MSDIYTIEKTTLQNIANAIREKTSSGDLIPVADMAAAIRMIDGGANALIDGSITEIESDVATVRAAAFGGASKLGTVSLPQATLLGEYAFAECPRLEVVNCPNVVEIENECFRWCVKLNDIVLTSAQIIGDGAFMECYDLARIDLPAATQLGNQAFFNCSALDTVILRSEFAGNPITNSNVFSGTPIETGDGYIYVPASMLMEYNQYYPFEAYGWTFRAIEDYPEITGG